MVADEIAGNIADGGCLCRGIGRVVNGAAVRRPGRFGNRAVADEIAGDVADGGAAAVERTVVDGAALRSVEEISLNAVVDKVAGNVADVPGIEYRVRPIGDCRAVSSGLSEKVAGNVLAFHVFVKRFMAYGAFFYVVFVISDGNLTGFSSISTNEKSPLRQKKRW